MKLVYTIAALFAAIVLTGMNASAVLTADEIEQVWTEIDPSFQAMEEDNQNLTDKDADLQRQLDEIRNGNSSGKKKITVHSENFAVEGNDPFSPFKEFDEVNVNATNLSWTLNGTASSGSNTQDDYVASAGSDSTFPESNPAPTMVQPSASMAAQPVVKQLSNTAVLPYSTQTIISSSGSSTTWTWKDMNDPFYTTEPKLKVYETLPNWKVALLSKDAAFNADFREAVQQAWNEQNSELKDQYGTALGQPNFVGI